MSNSKQPTIGIIGLGYVGLPLAIAVAKTRPVVAFDTDADRIAELQTGRDRTREVSCDELTHVETDIVYTSDETDLSACSIFIITVPTPVDKANQPDLSQLKNASQTVGRVMRTGSLVIYESTVYPGVTEEVCIPLLEQSSNLKHPRDFACGYSPERMNPGDKKNRLANIKKVTSGSTPASAQLVDALYAGIVPAGTHLAPSIKVAEAAKVIENTQRDLNIALMNELAIIFEKLEIDTLDVLEAAGTKWNFLPFRPGLVGGHCVGVDPYYLTHKAQMAGYHPEVVLAGRRINDSMGSYIADQVMKLMLKHEINPLTSRILILGLAFKEDCPDFRNTKVIDIIEHLAHYHVAVDVFDPIINTRDANREYGITCLETWPAPGLYDAIIIAVPHRAFTDLGAERIRALGKPRSVIFDVKGILPADQIEGRL